MSPPPSPTKDSKPLLYSERFEEWTNRPEVRLPIVPKSSSYREVFMETVGEKRVEAVCRKDG